MCFCATIRALFTFGATRSPVAHATADPSHPTNQMTFGLPFFPESIPWTPLCNITHAQLQLLASSNNSSDNFSDEFITLETLNSIIHSQDVTPLPRPSLKAFYNHSACVNLLHVMPLAEMTIQ
jgi:hypothetical protein